MEGTNNLQPSASSQRFSQRNSTGAKRKSLNEDISGITGETQSTNQYFQQLQKILNDQSMVGSAGHNNNINNQVLFGTSMGVNNQNAHSDDDYLDIDSPMNEDQNTKSDQLKDKRVRSSYKQSIDSQQINANEEIMDASKRSTSPPSSSIRQSLVRQSDRGNMDLSSKIHQLIQSNITQQQLLLKIIEGNEKEDLTGQMIQLQQIQIQTQEQLVILDKQYQQKQGHYEQILKMQNDLNYQRFKIKSELDNSPHHQQSSSMISDINSFFGSTTKFMQAFKTDSQLVFNFIKFQQSRIDSQPKIEKTKVLSQQLGHENNTGGVGRETRRKRSDPLFENEEYLKQIEEKYMQQFEQQLLQETKKQEINSLRQSKDKLSIINNDKKKEEVQKKKKRMQSDDKYDKKEYQERLEQQFMQIIRQNFPVDDSDEELEEKKASSKQVPSQTFVFGAESTTEKQSMDLLKEIVQIDMTQQQQQPQKVTMIEQQAVPQHRKKKSSKLLHIDMPEELVNLLGDSKDLLEDPNHLNYFEIEDEDLIVQSEDNGQINSLAGQVGIETPAFGKKKTPSLALFKGQAGTNSENEISGKKKRVQKQQSPDFLTNKSMEKTPFAYDNWKQEVKKVFQKKKQTQNVQTKSPAIVTMQQQMSPITKSKSPTSGLQSRNNRIENLNSQGTNMGTGSRLAGDKFSKTQSSFQSQQDHFNSKSTVQSKSPNSKGSFSSAQRDNMRQKTPLPGGVKKSSIEEAKKNLLNSTYNMNNSSNIIQSSTQSRNQKQGNLMKMASLQHQANPVDMNQQPRGDIMLDFKTMEHLTQSFTQSQQINSARIVGGGGRIPIGNQTQQKSRNNGPTKSPSLR